ncbi:MAG: hypothetical protein LBT09_01625 [Planctomycetaceae bacterium]|jgi:uncharacterized protein YpmS|nr:hypothetical protein [Planctomycetaceae bacterium]
MSLSKGQNQRDLLVRPKLTFRQIMKMAVYIFLGLLLILFLIFYLLYLSAQREPEFYREAKNVPIEVQQTRNIAVVDKIRKLNNDFQNRNKSWSGTFTAEEINAYLAVEATKSGANLLPPDLQEPRIAFSAGSVEIASKVRQRGLTAVLNISLGATMPEPNKLVFKMRSSQAGALPFPKDYIANVIADVLRKKWGNVTQGSEGGESTFTIQLNLKNSAGRKVKVESFEIRPGVIQFSGTTD